MTAPDIAHAPGCFGSALTYKAEAAECRSCMFASQCAPRSHERLIALRQRLGVKPPKAPQPVLNEPEPVKAPTALSTPKKVQEVMRSIDRKGIIVTEALARGENPFAGKKPEWLSLTCILLLRLNSGVTRDMLVLAMQRHLNWTLGTATAHALQAVQALKALGAAEEVDGRLRLKGR